MSWDSDPFEERVQVGQIGDGVDLKTRKDLLSMIMDRAQVTGGDGDGEGGTGNEGGDGDEVDKVEDKDKDKENGKDESQAKDGRDKGATTEQEVEPTEPLTPSSGGGGGNFKTPSTKGKSQEMDAVLRQTNLASRY